MSDKFENSRKSLKVFDADEPRRSALWLSVENNEDVINAQRAEDEAEDKVREAFFQDTKDFNSKSSCSRVSIEFVRQMVNGIDRGANEEDK